MLVRQTQLKQYVLLTWIFMLFGTITWANGDEGYNHVDENGQKQGYWMIKGYMVPDGGFQPDATVEEGLYRDNKKEGVWKKFYPSGVLRSEITYDANKPFGPYAIYYENAQLEEKGTWQRNKNVGNFERYYENGELQQRFFFADSGKRNGTQYYYHDNGQVELEVEIINGKEQGVMKRYFPDGRLKEEKTLNDGVLKEGSIKTYDRQATRPQARETPKADKEEPKDKAEENKPAKTNEAISFRPNGFNTMYNTDMQVTQVGEFKNGRLWNGKWNRYNQDGLLIRIEVYKNGKYIGTGVITAE